jgi:hypothetical protein
MDQWSFYILWLVELRPPSNLVCSKLDDLPCILFTHFHQIRIFARQSYDTNAIFQQQKFGLSTVSYVVDFQANLNRRLGRRVTATKIRCSNAQTTSLRRGLLPYHSSCWYIATFPRILQAICTEFVGTSLLFLFCFLIFPLCL